MYVFSPTSIDVVLSGFPAKLSSGVLQPRGLREDGPTPVPCFSVSGTAEMRFVCREVSVMAEVREERRRMQERKSDNGGQESGGHEKSLYDDADEGACSLPPRTAYDSTGKSLRFHAHPDTVTLTSVRVFSGKTQLKSSVCPRFTPVSSGPDALTTTASSKGGGGGKAGNKKGASSGGAAASAAVAQETADGPGYGLLEVVLEDGAAPVPRAATVGQALTLAVAFTTICRPATPHGTIGLYYYYPDGTDKSSDGHYFVTTHFEVHHARRAVPTIDDPRVRLQWRLQVAFQSPTGSSSSSTAAGSGEGPLVLSCAPPVPAQGSSTLVKAFAPTDPIPAYAFAFLAASSADLLALYRGADARPLVTAWGTSLDVRIGSSRAFAAKHPAAAPFALRRLRESVELLEDLLQAPIPLAGGKLDLLFVGRMTPALAGMEHHGLIYIAEAVWAPAAGPGARGGAGGPAAQADLTSLIAHEVCHHWVGNAIGMPFGLKEGICQVVEAAVLDLLEGRPVRRFVDSEGSDPHAHSAGTGGGGAGAAVGGDALGGVACGHELTGATYQKAERAVRAVASRGWGPFTERLQGIVQRYLEAFAAHNGVFAEADDVTAILAGTGHGDKK